MEEIDFEADTFEDIVAKDDRYDGRAYALLMDVVHYLTKNGAHAGAEDIMDEFRETALDQFGPLAYRVLTEWGLKSCEDIGEMMFNQRHARELYRRVRFRGGVPWPVPDVTRGPRRKRHV